MFYEYINVDHSRRFAPPNEACSPKKDIREQYTRHGMHPKRSYKERNHENKGKNHKMIHRRRSVCSESLSTNISPTRRVTRSSTGNGFEIIEKPQMSRHIRYIEKHAKKDEAPHGSKRKRQTSPLSMSRKTTDSSKVKGKRSLPNDHEADLKKKLIDTQSDYIKLEKKLEAKIDSLKQSQKSEISLKKAIQDATAEKNSFKRKWMELKREVIVFKQNLKRDLQRENKEKIDKQLAKINTLKDNLVISNENRMKAMTESFSHAQKNIENLASTSSTVRVQDDKNLFQDMLDNFKSLIETQLQCSICSEIYAFSTTVSCGHTFCLECIEEWKLKKRNCPICRSLITNQVHTKVLDDFIEKFVDGFVPEAFKNTRKELLEDRKRKKESREKLETEDQNRRLIHANRVDRSLEEIPDGSFGNPRSPVVERPDSDLEISSEDGLNIWLNSGSRWNFGISRERTSSRSSSSSRERSPRITRGRSPFLSSSGSSTPSSPMANRPETDSSESDTTWSPPPSEEMNVISENSNLSQPSSLSRSSTVDISDRSDIVIMSSPSDSGSPSRSRNRTSSRDRFDSW